MTKGKRRPKSFEFLGKQLRKGQIDLIIEIVELFPKNSRRELARAICENLNWNTSTGTYQEQFCHRVLEKFEEAGLIRLTEKQRSGSPRKPVRRTSTSDPGSSITCPLHSLEPITLEPAVGKPGLTTWTELVDRHHPRGYKYPIDRHLAYFIVDGSDRKLGCLMFETSGALACRDEWVGWTRRQRDVGLSLVHLNSRFLILPWVHVRNLASRALSLAIRQIVSELAEDRHISRWQGGQCL